MAANKKMPSDSSNIAERTSSAARVEGAVELIRTDHLGVDALGP